MRNEIQHVALRVTFESERYGSTRRAKGRGRISGVLWCVGLKIALGDAIDKKLLSTINKSLLISCQQGFLVIKQLLVRPL